MTTKIITIAKDFSPFPYGRYLSDGPNSGERFREEYLVPALRSKQQVEVQLDGVRGYGSSFLDEAFGGLVRDHGYTESQLVSQLRIATKYDSYKTEIWGYIKEATQKAQPDDLLDR